VLSGANSGGLGRRREQGSQACVENPSLAYVSPAQRPPAQATSGGLRFALPVLPDRAWEVTD
jgi:hypothetical protein